MLKTSQHRMPVAAVKVEAAPVFTMYENTIAIRKNFACRRTPRLEICSELCTYPNGMQRPS